jgi:pyruvate dehydrogenase E1 component alpha subunit
MPTREIAHFDVSYLQVLDEEGKVDTALDPKLSKKELLRLYRGMLVARATDEKGINLQRQGRMGTFGPSIGQEAVGCGAALAMGDKDWLVPSFREPSAMFMRGWSPELFFLFHRGFEEGNLFPEGSRTLPISIVVAAQLPHAVGLAHAARLRGEKDCAAVTFVGDGGTSEGDFHEALNFAGVWKAGVVCIVQNNQWAISYPRERQTAAQTLAQKAIAYGIPGIQVDGCDALAVYKATSEALERAHRGEGPTLIEAVSYRLVMHTTSDDPSKYRDEAESKEAWKKEPLVRFSKYLRKKRVLSAAEDDQLQATVKAEVEEAVARFEASLDNPMEQPFDHVFGDSHYTVAEQKRAFQESLKQGD